MSGTKVLLPVSIDRKAYKFVMSQRLDGLKHKDPAKLTQSNVYIFAFYETFLFRFEREYELGLFGRLFLDFFI